MSYCSTNELAPSTQMTTVLEVLELLGYERYGKLHSDEVGDIEEYYWFLKDDYQSWTGVELSVYKENDRIVVGTRTPVSRSYYDLMQQNKTIRLLKKLFGGSFETDEGKNRYMHTSSAPPHPAQAGCHLAFQRFGSNLIKAKIYFEHKNFPDTFKKKPTGLFFMDENNPWIISNNLILPFLVATIEDYFKSTFIAVLRSSENKETFLKSSKLANHHLSNITQGLMSVEDAIAENLPFQRIAAICKHFKDVDKNIDFATALRKPYRRRKISLYASLENIIDSRHRIIHRGQLDLQLDDEAISSMLHDVKEGIIRCYKHLTDVNGWAYEKWWGC